jgi:hypothetical protein
LRTLAEVDIAHGEAALGLFAVQFSQAPCPSSGQGHFTGAGTDDEIDVHAELGLCGR